MDILFLGTGSAWRLPEYSCDCMICRKMNELGEERTRTSIQIETSLKILIDPGPDMLTHMKRYKLEKPDLILVTHEHGDHFLGMDELLAYRRAVEREEWEPIPVYASETAWAAIEHRFGYLLGPLFDKKICYPGSKISIGDTGIIPFKTAHGPSAKGSVGYVVRRENSCLGSKTLVYTSDFVDIETQIPEMLEPDILVIQSHWLNEPLENRPFHMSLQRAMSFIRKWKPTGQIFLVHISGADQVPGDPRNNSVKKAAPKEPMLDPKSKRVYNIPLCQDDWDKLVERISRDYELACKMTVPRDGDLFSF